jgi:hypothetical protein
MPMDRSQYLDEVKSLSVSKTDPLALNFQVRDAALGLHLLGCGTTNEKTVLGGKGAAGDVESDPLALNFESRACGWIGWKESKRERKKRDVWICRQAWLYWEEPGGKKRSRYIPKAKLAAVQESVYELRRTIGETLEILGKK